MMNVIVAAAVVLMADIEDEKTMKVDCCLIEVLKENDYNSWNLTNLCSDYSRHAVPVIADIDLA